MKFKKILYHEKEGDNPSITQLMMLFLENHISVFHSSPYQKTQTRESSNNGEGFGIIDLFTKEAKHVLIV